MSKWQKERNFRKRENPDGSYVYVITVDGQDVEVGEAVYTAYAQGGHKMEYMENHLKRNRVQKDPKSGKVMYDGHGQPMMLLEREVSLDKLMDDDWDFPSPTPEEVQLSIEDLENPVLRRCMALLSAKEQAFINALLAADLDDQVCADVLGFTRQAVNKRKNRIIKKIKNFW